MPDSTTPEAPQAAPQYYMFDSAYALPPEPTFWDTFDKIVGAVRNFFATVGVLTFIGFIGYWSTK